MSRADETVGIIETEGKLQNLLQKLVKKSVQQG